MTLLKQLLEKLLCKHKWKVQYELNIWHVPKGKYPIEIRQTLSCIKCGAIKRITL